MSAAPPSYESTCKNQKPNNLLWREWYQRFIGLEFNTDEATEYARLFVNNEVEISMISDLNDGVLKVIGIEKAGHRIRILRLQKSRIVPQVSTVSTVQMLFCSFHSNVIATEKCYRCQRLLCLHCRRQKNGDRGAKFYCQNCYEECVIL